ncbi:MAG: A/G-specific adenine glycosylase, partial [Rhizobiaceae bacterium]
MTTMPEPGAKTKAPSFAERLLAWYDRHARDLPWRIGPTERARGVRPDPYRVWLSEIMLQQTTVEAVKPHFTRFAAAWPDIGALAAASLDEVLSAWAGLGYYSRARHLHRAAQTIDRDHGGSFPDDIAALRALPGIGDYTAGAIAAIAFDRAALAIDGNVDRVMARQLMLGLPPASAKAAIRAYLAALAPDRRHGDFAQALMDLGATVCMPRRAECGTCPVSAGCAAMAGGNPLDFPV